MTQTPQPSFSIRVPEGDDKPRRVCDTCGFIDYVNPKIVTGAVVVAPDGRLLLCRRAIEPRRGYWTLPAGYMEVGESTAAAAAREAMEEACAEIEIGPMLALYDVPRIGQVHVFFRARLLNPDGVRPGIESLNVALFEWERIPWKAMAFTTAKWALEHWRESRELESFPPYRNPAPNPGQND